jgi:hypothetical protein
LSGSSAHVSTWFEILQPAFKSPVKVKQRSTFSLGVLVKRPGFVFSCNAKNILGWISGRPGRATLPEPSGQKNAICQPQPPADFVYAFCCNTPAVSPLFAPILDIAVT